MVNQLTPMRRQDHSLEFEPGIRAVTTRHAQTIIRAARSVVRVAQCCQFLKAAAAVARKESIIIAPKLFAKEANAMVAAPGRRVFGGRVIHSFVINLVRNVLQVVPQHIPENFCKNSSFERNLRPRVSRRYGFGNVSMVISVAAVKRKAEIIQSLLRRAVIFSEWTQCFR